MCKQCIMYKNGVCTQPSYLNCLSEAKLKEERRLQEGGKPVLTIDGYDYEFVEHLGDYAIYNHDTKALVGYTDELPEARG